MAREREQYAPTLWLSRLGENDLDGTWAHVPVGPVASISQSVAALTGGGYTVVLDMEGDEHRVRLMPRRGKVLYENIVAHIRYSGTSLALVLSAAVWEMGMRRQPGTRVQVATRSYTRRVR